MTQKTPEGVVIPIDTLRISAYRNSFDNEGIHTTLTAAIKRISQGIYNLDEKTRYCHALAITEPKAYKKYKEKELPAVTFSGTFPKRKHGRRSANLLSHSGLVILDIDNLPVNMIPDLLLNLSQNPVIMLAFVSPSGLGIKAVVSVDPIPDNASEHKGAFQACLDYFEDLATEYEFVFDKSGSDVSRLCYLAHDRLAITRENARAINWDRPGYLANLTQPEPETNTLSEYTGDIDISALKYINPDDADETGNTYVLWLSVGMACRNAGLPVEVWLDWSRASQHFNESEIRQKWNTFDNYTGSKITWASIVHRAKANGYQPDHTRNASVRLHNDPEYIAQCETLDTLRNLNTDGIRQWHERTNDTDTQHLLIMTTGAGSGKSTAAVVNLEKYIDVSPITELANEKHTTAIEAGKNAYRHKSRLYNIQELKKSTPESAMLGLDASKGEVACVYPEVCNTLAEYGYSPSQLYCPKCPRYDECRKYGYLSQWDEMKKHDAIFFAYDEAFVSDPVFRGYIETITKKKDVVLILDEVNPADLPPKREFDTETLKNTAWNYREYEAGHILQQLIKETSTAITPSQWVESVKRVVGNLAETDVTEIDTQFQGVPVDVSFESVPPKHDLNGKVLYNTLATIEYEDTIAVCAVLKRRDGEKELPIGLFETLNTEGLHWIPDTILPNTRWHAGTQYPKLLNITTFFAIRFSAV